MRIRPLALLALLATVASIPNHASAADLLRADDYLRPGAVQVTIGTGTPEPWKGATVGAKVPLQSTGGVRSVGVGAISAVSIRGVVVGAVASTFDTDLAPGVTRIAFPPVTLEVTESVTGVQRLPTANGKLKDADVAFTFAPSSKPVADWVKTALAGTTAKRDVTVTMKDRQGATLRTISLLRCLPSEYTTTGAVSVVVVRPEAIQLKSTGHLAAFEWLTEGLSGNLTRRDVKLSFTDGAGRELSTTVLRNAYITEIAWSTLDKAASDIVTETITLQAKQLEPVP